MHTYTYLLPSITIIYYLHAHIYTNIPLTISLLPSAEPAPLVTTMASLPSLAHKDPALYNRIFDAYFCSETGQRVAISTAIVKARMPSLLPYLGERVRHRRRRGGEFDTQHRRTVSTTVEHSTSNSPRPAGEGEAAGATGRADGEEESDVTNPSEYADELIDDDTPTPSTSNKPGVQHKQTAVRPPDPPEVESDEEYSDLYEPGVEDPFKPVLHPRQPSTLRLSSPPLLLLLLVPLLLLILTSLTESIFPVSLYQTQACVHSERSC